MDKNKQAVFITGGTSGIGFSLVEKYIQEGFFVVINYCNGGKNISIVIDKLLISGYVENKDYIFFRADITNESELTNLFTSIDSSIIEKICICINNAGILKRGSILELNQSDWVDVFNVNVFGVVNVSKLIATKCKNLNNIVNIGSIRGEPAISRTNNIAYSISKSTIPTLTAVMAKSFGPQIRVNSILPGTIDTPQRQGISEEELELYGESNTICSRLGKPEEIAELCFFITSKKSSYITGSSFVIDGGYTVNYIK
ncbi:MAG: SDR family oxidoreductase [Candidatus Nomurabacteria bacterium]|nr:SDR family oxidoreductase [Candidatus Nomurabacteria bacterium]